MSAEGAPPPRPSQVSDLGAAVDLVADGMTVGLSGFSYQNPPMAVVREIVRRGIRDLTLVSGPTAGIETDLLIGAGCVRRVVTAGVVLERVASIAPAFRHHVERGDVEVWECDECIWYVALKAAAWGVPYLLWQGGVATSLPELNPALEEIDVDGRPFLKVPAVRPDIVFIHAAEADEFGNVRRAPQAYLGRAFAERALAEACAGPLICTTESIVDNETVLEGPEWTLLHGAIVVEAPWGAHPGGTSGRYVPDFDHLRGYARAAAGLRRDGGAAYRDYLDTYVHATADHAGYVGAVGGNGLDALRVEAT